MIKYDGAYLKHIIDCVEKIDNSVKEISKSQFNSDVDIQDAVIRRIEVIGEAAKGISEKLKSKYRDIEWKKIAGTRDVLIHAYFSIDLDLVWDIIKHDLPKLKKQILDILDEKQDFV